MATERTRKRAFRNEFRRRGRIIVRGRSAIYHVMSRAALQHFLLNDKEKAVFCKMLRKQAAFTGIEVLTYCIMGNHFHLLVRVPPSPLNDDGKHGLSDTIILERYRNYYGKEAIPMSSYTVDELEMILKTGGEEAEEARKKVLTRMSDLSAFMRELKQRFVIWYNHEHENSGTIWSARFKSLLVEDNAEVLTKVAAYIDLNPIRAKIVEDPKDYRWCGYADALANEPSAKEGLLGLFPNSLYPSFQQALKSYRLILFGKGTEAKTKDGKVVGRIPTERLTAVRSEADEPGLLQTLRSRVRYFSDGLILGTKDFIEDAMEQCGRRKNNLRRKSSTAPLEGKGWGNLHAARKLKP